MYISTPYYEDCADFVTDALICADCNQIMIVVGPVPPDPTCLWCGSPLLTCIPATDQAVPQLHAA